jgi:hypothetical protein
MALDPLRIRLLVTSVATVAGIVLSIAVDQTLGGFVTVGSIVALVATLHRFGRSGPA